MEPRRLHLPMVLTAVMLAAILSSCGKDNPTKPAPAVPPPTTFAPVQVTAYPSAHADASPNGARLAVEFGSYAIGVTGTDGGQLDTVSAGYALGPDWSPDGSHIAALGSGGLWVIDVATKQVSVLGSGDIDGAPDWSPDGSKIAARTTMGGDGIGITAYPSGDWSILPCVDQNGGTCDGEGPTWSPDGSAIAFEDGLEILRVSSGGGTASVVVEGLEDVTEPSWSPNGKWIAFAVDSTDDTTFPPTFFSHIWVVDSGGMQGGLRQVTFGKHTDREPGWSPDTRTIYFTSDRGGTDGVWKVGFQP